MVKSTSDFPHYRWNSLKCPFGPLHLHFLPARSVPRFHPLQGHGKKRKKPKNHFPHYRCMSRKWLFPSASFPLPFFPPMASDDRFDAGSSTFLISSSPPPPPPRFFTSNIIIIIIIIWFISWIYGGGVLLSFSASWKSRAKCWGFGFVFWPPWQWRLIEDSRKCAILWILKSRRSDLVLVDVLVFFWLFYQIFIFVVVWFICWIIGICGPLL